MSQSAIGRISPPSLFSPSLRRVKFDRSKPGLKEFFYYFVSPNLVPWVSLLSESQRRSQGFFQSLSEKPW